MKEGRGWNDAISQVKKALGFGPNEYVKDWDSVVTMAKGILAEDRGGYSNQEHTQPRSANDKTILAHYLSGKTIPERFLTKGGAEP